MVDLSPIDFELYDPNWDTFSAFLRVSSQWRMAISTRQGGGSYSRPCGLDMTAVDVVLRAYGTPLNPAMLDGLRTIERTIIGEVLKS